MKPILRISAAVLILIFPALPGAGFGMNSAALAQTKAPTAKAKPTPEQKVETEIQELKNSNADKRAQAANKLGQSGDPKAVQALTGALNDSSPKVRRQAVVALASFHTPQSLDGLIKATRDNDEQARWLAVRGIEGYYTGNVPKSGFFGFMERQYHQAKQQFVQNNIRVTPGTKISPQAVSALETAMMDTQHQKAARESARALGILMARRAAPDLVKAAHSNDQDLALEALNSLAKIKNTSAGPKLVDLVDSPNREIQRSAAVTVGILRTRSAVPKLESLYQNSTDKQTRESALQGLAYVGDPAANSIFVKALHSKDATMRTYAAEGLARTKDQRALNELLTATPAEKNDQAKLAMEFAVTSLGRDEYLSSIVNKLDSGQGDTAQAYLVELSRNDSVLSKLYPFMNSRSASVRERLCDVMMYSGNQSSIKPLERLSKDQNGDVAAAAINALRAVRERSSQPESGS